MMCRVIAPMTAKVRREAAPRSLLRFPWLHRRLRIARHRALRWFSAPIAAIERERRERDPSPSVWRPDFFLWPVHRSSAAIRGYLDS